MNEFLSAIRRRFSNTLGGQTEIEPFSKLRDCFFDIPLEPDENLRVTSLEQLFGSITCRPVSIVKGRSGEGSQIPSAGKLKSNHFQIARPFLDLLLELDENLRATTLEQLFESAARRPVSIVKGQSSARKPPRNKKFHNAKKAVV